MTTASKQMSWLFSFRKAALAAGLSGLIGSVFPYVALGLAILLVGLIYRRLDRSDFRTHNKALVVSTIAAGMFSVGAVGSIWCYKAHICRVGHMHHPPYAAYHFLIDVGWPTCLVLSCLCLYWIRSPISIASIAFTSFLAIYRFGFGSWGGIYPFSL